MARCNLERHLSDSDFQLVFEVRPKNVVVVPLLSFGKNLFADVRAGDGMIGEIIIEKKGTIVFFLPNRGLCKTFQKIVRGLASSFPLAQK